MFEDTKGVDNTMGNRKREKQYIQNITQKTTDRAT